jgi:hypothetical protein
MCVREYTKGVQLCRFPDASLNCFSWLDWDPVIQATGRSEFEDGLVDGWLCVGILISLISWMSALGCLIIQSRPNSKSNSYLSTEVKQHRDVQYLDGWPPIVKSPPQGKLISCWITSWGNDPMLAQHPHCTNMQVHKKITSAEITNYVSWSNFQKHLKMASNLQVFILKLTRPI